MPIKHSRRAARAAQYGTQLGTLRRFLGPQLSVFYVGAGRRLVLMNRERIQDYVGGMAFWITEACFTTDVGLVTLAAEYGVTVRLPLIEPPDDASPELRAALLTPMRKRKRAQRRLVSAWVREQAALREQMA